MQISIVYLGLFNLLCDIETFIYTFTSKDTNSEIVDNSIRAVIVPKLYTIQIRGLQNITLIIKVLLVIMKIFGARNRPRMTISGARNPAES